MSVTDIMLGKVSFFVGAHAMGRANTCRGFLCDPVRGRDRDIINKERNIQEYSDRDTSA